MLAPIPRRVGPRVRLAYPEGADRDEFLALTLGSRRFHRGLASPPTTPAAFARYLARSRDESLVSLLLRRRSDAAILGALELSQIVRGGFRSAYLGYWVGAPFAGEGYMSEGIALVLDFAFRTLRLHRIEANIQPGNAPSLALVRRQGFTREGYSRRYLKIGGRWRDHERWAILAEDWRGRS